MERKRKKGNIVKRDVFLIELRLKLYTYRRWALIKEAQAKINLEEIDALINELETMPTYNAHPFMNFDSVEIKKRKAELIKGLIYSVNYIKLQFKFDFPKGSAEAKFASSILFYGLSSLKLQETGAKFCDYTTKLLPNFNEQARIQQEITNLQNYLAELRTLTEAYTKAKSEKMVASKEWIKMREAMITKLHRFFLAVKFEHIDHPTLNKEFTLTKNFYPKKRKRNDEPEPETAEEYIETNEG